MRSLLIIVGLSGIIGLPASVLSAWGQEPSMESTLNPEKARAIIFSQKARIEADVHNTLKQNPITQIAFPENIVAPPPDIETITLPESLTATCQKQTCRACMKIPDRWVGWVGIEVAQDQKLSLHWFWAGLRLACQHLPCEDRGKPFSGPYWCSYQIPQSGDPQQASPFVLCDVDKNGRCDIDDSHLVRKHLGNCLGTGIPYDPKTDLDGDGCTTQTDEDMLLRDLETQRQP